MFHEPINNKPCTNCRDQTEVFTQTVRYALPEREDDDGWLSTRTLSKWEKFFMRFFIKFFVYTMLFTLFIAMPFSAIEAHGEGFWRSVQSYSAAFVNTSLLILMTMFFTAIITATITAAIVSRKESRGDDD